MNMAGIVTRCAVRVDNGHDCAVVGLVNAGQATAGKNSAGKPSQNPHVGGLDSTGADKV